MLQEMEDCGSNTNWSHLPAELVLDICHALASATKDFGAPLADAKTLLRQCCKDWWRALPIGHTLPANLWEWDSGAARPLALARRLRVLSPQAADAPASPLPHLASLRHLQALQLCHVAAPTLGQAQLPAALTLLHVTVHWTAPRKGWLDFAGHLTRLQELTVAAAVIRLQPECGLSALAPLAGPLRRLRLDNCVLAADAGALHLAALTGLRSLSLVPSSLGQAGTDGLAGALLRLQKLRIRVLDGVDPRSLLCLPGLTAVVLQMSRVKAHSFLAVAGLAVPQARRLSVVLNGSPSNFLLTMPFQGENQLAQLQSLNLSGMQLSADVVTQLARCTALQELTAELDWTVRSGALRDWSALAGLRALCLRCNFYLRDEDWQGLLSGMPQLQDLSLENMHGSGAALLPLRCASGLTRLRLAACHFESGAVLGRALRQVVCPGGAAALGGPRLAALELDGCGVHSQVVQAVIMALEEPRLSEAAKSGEAAAAAAVIACSGGVTIAGGSGRSRSIGEWDVEVETGVEGGSGGSGGGVGGGRAPALRRLRLELKWRVDGSEGQLAALTAAIARCTQLTALDVHFPALSEPQAAVPAWAALSSLTSLRALHVCSGLGWAPGTLGEVAGAAPFLRELALTDNFGVVGDEWLQALAPLSQLSKLELNSCKLLSEAGAVPTLARLTALTSVQSYRCPGITSVRVMEALRAALPCLARVSLRE